MEEKIFQKILESIDKAVLTELVGYGKPLSKIIDQVAEKNMDLFIEKTETVLIEVISHESFLDTMRSALKNKLASIIVGKMGGEFEKKINELKANPTTRAKVIIALEKMIDSITNGN